MTLLLASVRHFARHRWQTGLAILGVITPIAILTGAVLNHVLQSLGIQF